MSNKEKPLKAAFNCEWRDVVALNFEVDVRMLKPLLPAGTQPCLYSDRAILTLMAKDIREFQPWGKSFTLFRSIMEVDLRTYVQQEVDGKVFRGHFKLRNLVNNKLGCRVLKFLTGQKQTPIVGKHSTSGFEEARRDAIPAAEFQWKIDENENKFRVKARNQAKKLVDGTKEQFVLQQMNRFVKTSKGTMRMPIRQAPWLVWNGSSGSFDCSANELLDSSFRKYLSKPSFVLMSRGGQVTVFKGKKVAS